MLTQPAVLTAEPLDDDGGEWMPDYWVPGEDEQGLLEVLSVLPPSEVVYVHTRPIAELMGNMADYTGGCIDLAADVYVYGKTHALRMRAEATAEHDVVRASRVAADIADVSRNTYIPVKYRDFSRWAARRYPTVARGGFLAPVEGGRFPFVINPFARSYVDRAFMVVVNSGPAYLLPITDAQFMLASAKMYENALTGRSGLSQQQYEEVASHKRVVEPLVPAMGWGVHPAQWPPAQRAFTGACVGLVLSNLYCDKSDDRTPGAKMLHVAKWLACGFTSALCGTFAASRQALLTPEAPVAAVFTGVLSLFTTSVYPMSIVAAFSGLASYRIALLQPEAVMA